MPEKKSTRALRSIEEYRKMDIEACVILEMYVTRLVNEAVFKKMAKNWAEKWGVKK